MPDRVAFPLLGRHGRLGNSLWQVASTIGLARRYGVDPLFPEDWAYRPFFSLPDEWYGNAEVGVPAPDLAGGDTYLQDLRLWANVNREVRAVFEPSRSALSMLAALDDFARLRRPVLSVHVRRGDNAFDPLTPDKHLYHPLRPTSYYLEAIDLLRPDAASIAVFSDDPGWAMAHLPLCDYYHRGVPRLKEHEEGYWTEPVLDWIDLFLMARCQGGHVVSNSTFAWWGAWLSGDERVTYHWPWYGERVAADASLMIPSGWTRFT